MESVAVRLSGESDCRQIVLSMEDHPSQRPARQILRLHAGVVDVPEPGVFVSTLPARGVNR